MDIKRLQESIIGSAVGESQFKRVSWLIPRDFDVEYRKAWESVLSKSGGLELAYSNNTIYKCVCLADYTFIDRLGLKLLEYRFKQYAQDILTDMMLQSEDEVVGVVIKKTLDESDSVDSLELVDSLPEYISTFTDAKRLFDLRDYVNSRAEIIRKSL